MATFRADRDRSLTATATGRANHTAAARVAWPKQDAAGLGSCRAVEGISLSDQRLHVRPNAADVGVGLRQLLFCGTVFVIDATAFVLGREQAFVLSPLRCCSSASVRGTLLRLLSNAVSVQRPLDPQPTSFLHGFAVVP